jgi:hypothetical protein
MSTGFVNHGKLALARDAGRYTGVGDYKKNGSEKLGDKLLFASTTIPSQLRRWLTNPQVVTVLLTLAALILVTLLFYPIQTAERIVDVINWIFDHVKMIAQQLRLFFYILSVSQVIGLGIRSFGRFGNKALMGGWYQRFARAQ